MKRMILIDGNSLMYRAYYGTAAMGNLMENSKGLYTNAIYGFAKMVNNLCKSEYDAILVAFDAGKKTLRHEWMEDYKGGRAPMPDEFRMQIAYIKEFLDISRIKRYEQELYEADDIIGTMAKRGEEAGYHVDIYSSDKDLLQLISDKTTVHMTKKGMTELEDFDPIHFKEKYGIDYTQWVDLKALMGDPSDNLPGIPGVGEKTGVKLLNQYGNLDGIIEHRAEIKGALGAKVEAGKDSAKLCQKMATILREFDLPLNIDDIERKNPDNEKLLGFYKELEFKSMIRDMSLDAPKPVLSDSSYTVISDSNALKDVLSNNSALVFETFDYNYHKSPLLGIGVKNDKGSFIIEPELLNNDNKILINYLSDKNNHKVIFDYKRAYVISKRYGVDLNGVDFDLLLATYVINPTVVKDEFKGIAEYYEYDDVYYDEQVYGKGAKKAIPDRPVIYDHIFKKVNALYALKDKALEKLNEYNCLSLLTDIEIPLSRVLGKMEYNGMLIDLDELNRQESELIGAIDETEQAIFKLVGHEFNVASPKQLGTVLFEEMGLPYPKKKGNSYSTDQSILDGIKDLNPIVPLIMEYRAKSKLYSTYITGIRDVIYPDGKVHTIYQQALTQTGRLSSIEPNLQNIPIRTPEGHKIRKMFVPENPMNSMYSADYSQVELRVLAHMANVSKLIDAFKSGEDIHTKTAQEIFKKKEITPDDRRKAKAVNFGIVYGISAFGLANDIGITNSMASEFIKNYYEVYPEIKEFMNKVIEDAKVNGYVSTMMHRRRYIPDINSKIFMAREFAKRTAMNTPIQGSAADIIKIAMVNVDKRMEEAGLKSKLLVQVHDELVFEVELGEEDELRRIVKESMEKAVELSVPLIIDDSFGRNWYEVK
ncbi:MAG: DNA polymerase I [Acholeplasmatales bacterium]|nr:DNA polymerase I [Acholeplasmatales bacterium]